MSKQTRNPLKRDDRMMSMAEGAALRFMSKAGGLCASEVDELRDDNDDAHRHKTQYISASPSNRYRSQTTSYTSQRRESLSSSSDLSKPQCQLPPIRQLFPELYTGGENHSPSVSPDPFSPYPTRDAQAHLSPGYQRQNSITDSPTPIDSTWPASRVQCQGCGISFRNKADHKRHWNTSCSANQNKTPRFVCPVPGCTETFARRDGIRPHLERGRCKIGTAPVSSSF